METERSLRLAILVVREALYSQEALMEILLSKTNVYARILFTLKFYFMQHSENFHNVHFLATADVSTQFNNSTVKGIFGRINRSEIDVLVGHVIMTDETVESVGLSYPFGFSSLTFAIQQHEYDPEILGILKTFSLTLWIAITSIIIAISFVNYATFQSKHHTSKIMLHVFAVFLRQSSILKPSCWTESLLLYSWVIGAMLICLMYDSVFLSFLTFPPINPIKDLSDLSKAIKMNQYHCFYNPNALVFQKLLQSRQENLKVVAADIFNNGIRFEDVFEDFYFGRKKMKLALLINTELVDVMIASKKFVSEDYFLQSMHGMAVRRDFCCKKMLDTFVHRLMASGIYFKFKNDRAFYIENSFQILTSKDDNSERMLTPTDLAPAFIALLAGYFISFFILIGEIVSDRKKKKKLFTKTFKMSL